MKKLRPNMSDEELDQLFREAAEKYQPPAHPEAWSRLEASLDKASAPAGGQRSRSWRRWSLLLLLLLLAGSITWLTLKRQGKNTTAFMEKQATTLSSTPRTPSEKNSTERAKTSEPTVQSKAAANQPQPEQPQPRAIQRSKTGIPSEKKSASSSYPFVSGTTQDKTTTNSALSHADAGTDRTGQTQVPEAPQKSNAENDHILSGNGPAASISNDHPNTVGNDNEDSVAATSPEVKKNRKNKSAKTIYPRWETGLTLGPDWSMVKGIGLQSPGVDAGLTVQYRFAQRFYVQSGVLFSTKIYTANGKDYHPATPVSGLEKVDANCSVIDVPIGIRADVWQSKGERIFLGTGLSSFWMKKEAYKYEYKINGTSHYRDWSIYNQNRHLFSVLNISAGYEHNWKHLSLEAAPYLKLPLGGIGYGKVKLMSTGVSFSIKYGF